MVSKQETMVETNFRDTNETGMYNRDTATATNQSTVDRENLDD